MTVGDVPASIEELRRLPLEAEVRGLELPEVQAVGPWQARRPTRKAMLGSRFYVYGKATRLTPPIDWLQDPHGSRTWCYELQTLSWLKEALARHTAGGDVETLAAARDVVLDWARSHLRPEPEQSEFAWYDMAVGLRAPYIGYVLRACLAEGLLDDEGAQLLLEVAERHGEFLAAGANHAAGNNHGLFQDEGLYLLARQLPALPAATAWRELALTRLRATLASTVSFADGAHLEHSPAYQLAIVDLVARLAANVSNLPELRGLLDRMRRTAAWQTTPAGRMAQLGDTDDLRAPKWAADTASSLRGLNPLFEAGQAFVRDGDSYLAVSAAYHGQYHKHADDTGLLLVERGAVVLGDAGRWGYYEREPERLYARSAAAHNVVTVDGEDFDWRRSQPYGSGLVAAGEGDGWYAIAVRNPLLRRDGVAHRRLLVYRPAETLVVIDEVRSEQVHEYARRFHFGPGLEARRVRRRGVVRLAAPELTATLCDLVDPAEAELVRGRAEPRRIGWSYPGDRERRSVWTALLRSRAAGRTFATALSLGEKAPSAVGATLEGDRATVERDGAPNLLVTLDGRRARVEER